RRADPSRLGAGGREPHLEDAHVHVFGPEPGPAHGQRALGAGRRPAAAPLRAAAGQGGGLTVKPDLLTEIRNSRLANLGLPPESAYANKEKIREELALAEQVFRRLRCPV